MEKILSAYISSDSGSREEELVDVESLTAITEDLLTGYVGGGVPYLGIKSFTQWDNVAQAKLEDFFSSISHEDHLIIDVRGNGGGDDGAWRSGIVPFLAQQEYEFNLFWAADQRCKTRFLGKASERFRRRTAVSVNKQPYLSMKFIRHIRAFQSR